ncbi:MAG: methylenetetrahydrofolate reductase C-terminal domain-containing protein [Thermoguttaceae bacterium]|jgi:ferredoxin
MIVADRKKIPEIRAMIQKHQRVLLVGCGTCVTVCLAGGEREVGILASALRMSLRLAGRAGRGLSQVSSDETGTVPLAQAGPQAETGTVPLCTQVDECTIERQCEDAFIDLLAPRVPEYDAICSLGCGAGVQALAERFPATPVYPGLNTQFIGILQSQGVWTEKCAGCGQCRLGEFAGICPITRCAKRLLNGPCGGSRDGICEVRPDTECGWQRIYDRASALGIVEQLRTIAPPHDWSTGWDGGPRRVVREDQHIGSLLAK